MTDNILNLIELKGNEVRNAKAKREHPNVIIKLLELKRLYSLKN